MAATPWRTALCAVLVLLAGCASPKAEKKTRGLARIVDTGELRVGTSGEQPPLTMTARSGEPLGLDVALARVLAKSMGVEAHFVVLPFGRLLDSLEAGEVDLVISGMTITPERSRRVTFVGPYFTSGKTILTRSPELAAVTIPEDLDSSGLRVSALAGSTSEAFARRSLPRAKLEATETLEEAIALVLDGTVDALVADRETCSFGALRHEDAGLLAGTATFTVEPMGIAVPQDQPQLANLIQTYLTALQNAGVLDKARKFWFQDPSWVRELR
jgi:ABC-type amino acid transport substrate-binding protein